MIAVDEMFIHTICFNSYFYKNVSDHIIRLIDWKRGNPYIWDISDMEEIYNSDALFIRKVQDKKIMDLIDNYIQETDYEKNR